MEYTEFEDKEKYIKELMESCELYLNKDLYDYKKDTVKIENIFSDSTDKINAVAKIDKNGQYSITIYNGVYAYIDDFYKEMLKNSDFYYIISGGKEYSEVSHNIYYNIMKQLTIKSVIYHEMGHVYNGHLDYIRNKKNTPELSLYSFENKDRSFLEPMVWQSIEWNADDFAATRMIGQFTFKDFIDRSYIVDERHGLLLATIAILVVYALKGMGRGRTAYEQVVFDKYMDQEHLPKRFRVEQYIKAEFNAYQEMNLTQLPEETKQYLFDMATTVENFICTYEKEHLGANWEIADNNDELDDEHRDYYEQVEGKYLCEVAFELEEYSYFQVVDAKTKAQVINTILSQPEYVKRLNEMLSIGSDCEIEFVGPGMY